MENNVIKWKTIEYEGTPTNYYISEDGQIRNMADGTLLNPFVDKNDYKRYTLRIEPKTPRKLFAHRLVALAFIPNPENKPQVNHIDGNKSNNHFTNLEWVTVKENIHHSYENGSKQTILGENNSQSKYNEQNIREICKYLEIGIPADLISKRFNITESYLSEIRHGNRWGHIWKKFRIQPLIKPSDIFRMHVESLFDQGYDALEIVFKSWGTYDEDLHKDVHDIVENHVRSSETIEKNLRFSVDKTQVG